VPSANKPARVVFRGVFMDQGDLIAGSRRIIADATARRNGRTSASKEWSAISTEDAVLGGWSISWLRGGVVGKWRRLI
jgi:hypothetical protein